MKKLSVKLRVTIWYTVFVAVLTAVFMVILISSAVRTSNSLGRMRLTNAVDWAVHAIKYNNDGSLKISLKTDKTKGVDIVVYNMDNNILIMTPAYQLTQYEYYIKQRKSLQCIH